MGKACGVFVLQPASRVAWERCCVAITGPARCFLDSDPDPRRLRAVLRGRDGLHLLSDALQIAFKYKPLLQEVNSLVATPAWDQRVPPVLSVLGQVDTEIDQLVYPIFALNSRLIVRILVALFAYRYASARWVTPKLPNKA